MADRDLEIERLPFPQTFALYCLVGAVVTTAYILSFTVLASAMPRLGAAVVAYAFGCAIQYFGNAALTFKREVWDGSQILRYIVTVAFGLSVSIFILESVAPRLQVPDAIAALGAAVVVTLLNFVVMFAWTFSARWGARP